MTEDMLLVLAMSTDAFFAALSYSTEKKKIPAVSENSNLEISFYNIIMVLF